jgi:hypothetical protein
LSAAGNRPEIALKPCRGTSFFLETDWNWGSAVENSDLTFKPAMSASNDVLILLLRQLIHDARRPQWTVPPARSHRRRLGRAEGQNAPSRPSLSSFLA